VWVERLRRTLDLQPDDVYEVPNHLNVVDFMELAQLPIPELRDPPFNPRLPRELRRHATVFDAVRERDVLLHHPFHAFDAVQRLLDDAADDPDVLAIKQTLYRSVAARRWWPPWSAPPATASWSRRWWS
jgi:polyphosphate kinase